MRKGVILLAALLLFGAAAFLALRRGPAPKLALSMWFWHSPFRLQLNEAEALKRMGVQHLFVRGGTLSMSTEGPVGILPQRWPGGAQSFDLDLVLPFDRGVIRHFEDTPTEVLAKAVSEEFVASRNAAEASGHRVQGLQIDFDCPTRLLPRYAKMLREIRAALPKDQRLSIAALATWLTASAYRDVLEPLDFHVPQFYEGEMPKRLDDFKPVADQPSLEAGIRQAEMLRKPYWVGLPAYGHTLAFDADKKLVGTLRGLSPSQAPKQPRLEWAKTENLGRGARLAVFRDREGSGFAAFEIVQPKLLRELLGIAREAAGPNCQGISIFRFPEPEEELSVPLASIEAAVKGTTEAPVLSARWSSQVSPWKAIESAGQKETLAEVWLDIENRGKAATDFCPSAVEARIGIEPAGLESAEAGDADVLVTEPTQSSISRARTAVLRLSRLSPGQRVQFGPLRLPIRPTTKLSAKVVFVDPENGEKKLISVPEWKPK